MKIIKGKDRNGADRWVDINSDKRVCGFEECMVKHNKKGYCTRHYRELLEKDRCTWEACEGKVFAKSLCTKHYKQIYRHGEILHRTIYDRNQIVKHENFAELKLYNIKGEYVASSIVDLEDIEKVQKYKWHLNDNGYVRSKALNDYLHRFIMDAKSEDVDHRNHDSLDNRKSNLRECLHRENNRNMKTSSNSNTGIKGVYRIKNNGRFYAYINADGIRYYSRHYEDISDAITCREIMELYLFKEYSSKYEYLIEKYGVISVAEFEECVASRTQYNTKR